MRDDVFKKENVVANDMMSATTMERMMGVDLRCGGGQDAALERHRRSIHSRSRSTPFRMPKRKTRLMAGLPFWSG